MTEQEFRDREADLVRRVREKQPAFKAGLQQVLEHAAAQAPDIRDVYAAQTPVPPSQWPRELEPFAGTPWEDRAVAESRAHEVNWALSLGPTPRTFEEFARQSAILMREGIGENFEGLAGNSTGAFAFRGSGNEVMVQEVDAEEVAAIAQKALRIANGDEPKPTLDSFTTKGSPVILELGDA